MSEFENIFPEHTIVDEHAMERLEEQLARIHAAIEVRKPGWVRGTVIWHVTTAEYVTREPAQAVRVAALRLHPQKLRKGGLTGGALHHAYVLATDQVVFFRRIIEHAPFQYSIDTQETP